MKIAGNPGKNVPKKPGRCRDFAHKERGLAWIIGSGPGLNNVDVRRLKDKATFAFNRSYIAWDEWGFAPRHYAVIDLRVMGSIARDVNQLIQAGTCETYHFYDGRAEGQERVIDEAPGVYFYELRDGWGFDPERPYYCGDVAAFSLQTAYELGYRRACVVGVDLVWPERREADAPMGGRIAYGADVEHFREDYYPEGMVHSYPIQGAHYRSWKASVAAARKYGMEIINCGPGSRLNEMVEYRDFDECLRD